MLKTHHLPPPPSKKKKKKESLQSHTNIPTTTKNQTEHEEFRS